jgi:hypothetical protein
MYLLSITSAGYIWLSIFFILHGLCVYYVNRKKSAVYNATNLTYNGGILEFVFLGIGGATLGMPMVYLMIVVFVIAWGCGQLVLFRYRQIKVTNFSQYVNLTLTPPIAIIMNIIFIVILVLLSSMVIAIGFKLLQSILGVLFINKMVVLIGATIILLLLGGSVAAKYYLTINNVIIFCITFAIISIGIIALGGIVPMYSRLVHFGGYYQHNINSYSNLKLILSSWFVLIISSWLVSKLILLNATAFTFKKVVEEVWHIVTIGLLVILGILAVITPPNNSVSAGKSIVTLQSQLPDGQIAYVIKTINTPKTDKVTLGIVPPLLNPKTNIIKPNQYNFYLASISAINHYIGANYRILVLIIILAVFITSLTTYVYKLSQITTDNIISYLRLINTDNHIGLLWAYQLSVVAYTIISTLIGYWWFYIGDLLLIGKLVASFILLPTFILMITIILIAPYKQYAK